MGREGGGEEGEECEGGAGEGEKCDGREGEKRL